MFNLKSFMTKRVLSVKKDDLVYDAMKILCDKKISGVPVVNDDNKLVGIFSEMDCISLLTKKFPDKTATVEQFMTKKVISFSEEDSAIDVAEFFERSNKRRVPVTKNEKLIGIVSRRDIVKLILSLR